MDDKVDNKTVSRPLPPPLPATKQDLLAQKTMTAQRTLNDYVDDIHLALWDNAHYQKLLEAVYPEEAVEGSLPADDLLAAMAIRDYAKEHKIDFVIERKLATIMKALKVVARRYHISRHERRNMIGGEVVRPNGNDYDES